MFKWFSRGIEAEEYFTATKKIVVNGVIFHVKKISVEDHLSGLNTILQIWDVYKKKKPDPNTAIDDVIKIRKFCKDIILAGVVKPELTAKKDEPNKISVDEVLKDLAICQKLTSAIISYSYGKKK